MYVFSEFHRDFDILRPTPICPRAVEDVYVVDGRYFETTAAEQWAALLPEYEPEANVKFVLTGFDSEDDATGSCSSSLDRWESGSDDSDDDGDDDDDGDPVRQHFLSRSY